MTIASSLATVLAAHTDHACGVMGEGNAAFLHHDEEAGKPVTPVRHESAAVAIIVTDTTVSLEAAEPTAE